jgi:outer membrane lipoprotein-sorting protein
MFQRKAVRWVAVTAAAAAVVFTVSLWPGKAGKVWAIEQTIAAMRSVTSIHAYCTDWDGTQAEAWVQINPETGEEQYCRADQPVLQIVATPDATYYYHKDKNLVRIRKGYVPASEVRFSRFLEDIVEWTKKYSGEIGFSSQYDKDLQHEVIMVRVTIPAQANMGEKDLTVRVDSQTKLPISMQVLKGRPGEGLKSLDRIEYNVAIPEGAFEFKIPEGVKVVYE